MRAVEGGGVSQLASWVATMLVLRPAETQRTLMLMKGPTVLTGLMAKVSGGARACISAKAQGLSLTPYVGAAQGGVRAGCQYTLGAWQPGSGPAAAAIAGADVAQRAQVRWAVLRMLQLFLNDEPDVLLCTFAERGAMKVLLQHISDRSPSVSEFALQRFMRVLQAVASNKCAVVARRGSRACLGWYDRAHGGDPSGAVHARAASPIPVLGRSVV